MLIKTQKNSTMKAEKLKLNKSEKMIRLAPEAFNTEYKRLSLLIFSICSKTYVIIIIPTPIEPIKSNQA